MITTLYAEKPEDIDAERAIRETTQEVLERNWKDNPTGKGYSQHKQGDKLK
jgi:hypothetical protein